jgi:ABC-type methionine transport system permease subunit
LILSHSYSKNIDVLSLFDAIFTPFADIFQYMADDLLLRCLLPQLTMFYRFCHQLIIFANLSTQNSGKVIAQQAIYIVMFISKLPSLSFFLMLSFIIVCLYLLPITYPLIVNDIGTSNQTLDLFLF